jgi:hypothetical protein
VEVLTMAVAELVEREWKGGRRTDGGPTLATHAGRGKVACDVYREKFEGPSEPVEEGITDLIADLLHYAAQQGLDEERVARMAMTHFICERDGD